MKTSNKLLIITALILIAIPMVAVVYVSKAEYKDNIGMKDYRQSKLKLSTSTEGFETINFTRDFNSIVVSNGGYILLELVKDKEFGVKISNENRKLADIEVSASGELMIKFDADPNKKWGYKTIIIYAPDFSKLNLAKTDDVIIDGNLQTLNINATHVRNIRLNKTAIVDHMKIEADSVTGIELEGARINNFDVTLNYGNLNSLDVAYDHLTVHASGKSGVGIIQSEKNKSSINSLSIHTSGQNSITLTNLKIDTLTGSLSEQTEISMPMMYIKQLLK